MKKLILFGFFLLTAMVTANPALAAQILWSSWAPRVVDVDTTATATLTVVVDSDPAVLDLALTTNGCGGGEFGSIPLMAVAPNTYEATLTSAQLFNASYRQGDDHAIVGCLKLSGAPWSNMDVNVRTEEVPDVPILQLATDSQASPHVLNLRSDDLLLGSHPPADLLQRFYLYFADDFDFIAVLDQVETRTNRSYRSLRNNVQGIGTGTYDRMPSLPPRLRGTIIYPIDSLFDAAEKATTHELSHQWMNHLSGSLADRRGGAHWPISDLAYGILGYSGQGGQGLNFPYSLVAQTDGSFLLLLREAAREFNDMELYLMGLIGPDAVEEHIVFQNQDQQVSTGGTLDGPVDVVTVQDVIDSNGPRIPAAGDAQTDFRLATIVLSNGRLLDQNEMAFFDHMAARGESQVELPFTSGLTRGMTKPFFLATGGRATLSTTILEDISAVEITVPVEGQVLQNGAILRAKSSDPSVTFSVRKDDGNDGGGIGYENLLATYNSASERWEYYLDTTALPDGDYLLLAKAFDAAGSELGSDRVSFRIGNLDWAVMDLLPSAGRNKAGRTMPIKFSLRVATTVDPLQPFVHNEKLKILIYDMQNGTDPVQTSTFGKGSSNYRIDDANGLYITNFKTSKTPTTYEVEIWSEGLEVESFRFETVK